MRGIKAFIIQDQDTGNPIFGRVEYPRKGPKPETVTVPILEIARDILPDIKKVVFDKWFSVGSLLEYLDKNMRLKFVTLMKLYENRIEEMKSIPVEEFKSLVGTDRSIAFKDTTLRNFSGSTKLIVAKFFDGGEEKYHGYLTNDYEESEVQIIDESRWRWRIENFFKECDFLGLNALPGIELNKIAAMMAMRLFSFCVLACLKNDVGREFEKRIVESIFEEIIEFSALVKAKGDRIIVTFYGGYKEGHKVAVETLMGWLDESGQNVPMPWRGN